HLKSLRKVLKRFDNSSGSSGRGSSGSGERVDALDGEIRVAIRKFEDAIESHVSNQFLSQCRETHNGSHPLTILALDMKEVKHEIDSFNETIKKMEGECINELNNLSREEDDAVSSIIGYVGTKWNMVGFSDQFQEIRTWLLEYPTDPQRLVSALSLVGMTGIGKTTLAVQLFEDPLVSSYFDVRVFITVRQKCDLKEILQGILAQMNLEIDKMLDVGDLKRIMYQNLKGKKCLFVLDDVWNMQVWDVLRRLFSKSKSVCRVLLTTRLQNMSSSNHVYKIGLLNKEESWDLLREKVFVGKKIAENCDGLPLLIVTVAEFLSKADKTTEYWKKVAEKENSIFMDANDQMMSKVLFSSYKYLSQYSKACFMYMGVFPQNYEIPCSKLLKLWNAEGFLEPTPRGIVIDELVLKSLVVVHKKSWNMCYISPGFGINTCGLHSVFWNLCNREAEKNKFFHVVNRNQDTTTLVEGIEHHRRLCIRKGVLFAIKDVNKSISSNSNARSLLCFGPYQKYPVPICFEYLRLLRVFDALTIRMYEFPMEVLKLVQLRYLALTYDGKLPPSISKLRSLKYLIILRHLNIIKSCISSSYLPKEIWDMQELRHLHITGCNLPDPCGAGLRNLRTLLDVSPHCFTKELLARFYYLSSLRIRFDLAPNSCESFNLFDLNSHLRLSSLKCITMNPIPRSEVSVPPPPIRPGFYSNLSKLSLSGFGYPWEYMKLISPMPYLQVLKLRCYAFLGAKWETQDKGFPYLKVLVIEDSDLMQWTVGIKAFPCLELLTVKNCHKLEGIPRDFAESDRLSIELVDCSRSASACVKRMQEEQRNKGRDFLKVSVTSSWDT
ncbi:hypothetical protein MIMGU_mgv1a020047mg, partial [Erythranthe guttata]